VVQCLTFSPNAGGHKANLNNPQTSDEAKQHSKEMLDSMK